MTRRDPHGELSRKGTRFLREARAALGITQVELGAALGITGLEVSRKERGDRPLTKVQALAVECLLRRAGKWAEKSL